MVIKCYFKYICLASHKSYYTLHHFCHHLQPSLSLAPHYPKIQIRAIGATTIIHYSSFITPPPRKNSPQKNRADSRPLRLIIFCLLLYPLTAQDLRKQRQDRQYSYKLCRMCSYRPQRNIRYPDRRTGADHHLLCSMSCPRPQTSKDLSDRHL